MVPAYTNNAPEPERLYRQDITDIYLAFMDAFSKYQPPVKLTIAEFERKFFNFYQTDTELSAGIRFENKLAGFALVTSGSLDNMKTAWISALGIRTAYRRRGWGHLLVEYVKKICRSHNLEKIVLEVQSQNKGAISLFAAHGFAESRKLAAYSVNNPEVFSGEHELRILDGIHVPISFSEHNLFVFQETLIHIQGEAKKHLTMLVYNAENAPAGYLLMDSESGRIRHIFVLPHERRQGFGSALIAAASNMHREIVMLNVDRENTVLCNFLEKAGFRVTLEQYEMTLNF